MLQTRANLLSSETRLASTLYQARNRQVNLMGATGRIYDIAGVDLEKEMAAAAPVREP